MAKEPEEGKEEGEAPKKPKKKLSLPLIPLIVFGVFGLILVGSTGLIVYTLKFDHKKVNTEKDLVKVFEDTKNDVSRIEERLFPLEPFTINLGGDRRKEHLKITIQLEVFDPALTEELKLKLPIIRHTIITLLSQKTKKQLDTVQDKLFLKNQLITELNKHLATGTIRNVYWSSFLLQ